MTTTGFPNASDCAPLNAGDQPAAGPRRRTRCGSARRLRVATLKWLHAYQAPTYNVYRGTFGGGLPFAYNETCFDTENATRTVDDSATPTAGNRVLLHHREPRIPAANRRR